MRVGRNALTERVMKKGGRVVIVGAGIGGLVCALELARQGVEVCVCEKAPTPGGKIRTVDIDGAAIDSGPTVFTMRWVFDEIFDAAGAALDDHLTLVPAAILARHAWPGGARLDLHADVNQSAEAIAQLSGRAAGQAYLDFCARARATYETLEAPFILSPQPSPASLAFGAGLRGLGDLWRISPFTTLWQALSGHFQDPRLRQLFGRYATYCGSSPFECPATLMLVAHVEQQGVWLVDGGMHRLAAAVERLGIKSGAVFRYNSAVCSIETERGAACGVTLDSGERLDADAVIVNADPAAVAAGLLGRDVQRAAGGGRPARSLSAVTWSMRATASGFPLSRHNVFFSGDYGAEFDDIFRRQRLPQEPTVYVCAQDRGDATAEPPGPERLLVLVNAPATGDRHAFEPEEVDQCSLRTLRLLHRCGLELTPHSQIATTPADFNRLFPGTGGALYGPASHGWTASFSRPTAGTPVPRLYLAGGSTHPGPGVPMAALSGRMAAARVLADLASMRRSYPAATSGGTSTR
jgi:1-hydroxycarotenoid 3,4-desaturase